MDNYYAVPLSILHYPLSFDVIYFDAFAPEKQPERMG